MCGYQFHQKLSAARLRIHSSHLIQIHRYLPASLAQSRLLYVSKELAAISSQDGNAFYEHVDEVLDEVTQLKAGNIRNFGLSNESAWGTSTWLQAAKKEIVPEF